MLLDGGIRGCRLQQPDVKYRVGTVIPVSRRSRLKWCCRGHGWLWELHLSRPSPTRTGPQKIYINIGFDVKYLSKYPWLNVELGKELDRSSCLEAEGSSSSSAGNSSSVGNSWVCADNNWKYSESINGGEWDVSPSPKGRRQVGHTELAELRLSRVSVG